jgi:hypothetical protein
VFAGRGAKVADHSVVRRFASRFRFTAPPPADTAESAWHRLAGTNSRKLKPKVAGTDWLVPGGSVCRTRRQSRGPLRGPQDCFALSLYRTAARRHSRKCLALICGHRFAKANTAESAWHRLAGTNSRKLTSEVGERNATWEVWVDSRREPKVAGGSVCRTRHQSRRPLRGPQAFFALSLYRTAARRHSRKHSRKWLAPIGLFQPGVGPRSVPRLSPCSPEAVFAERGAKVADHSVVRRTASRFRFTAPPPAESAWHRLGPKVPGTDWRAPIRES